MLPFFPWGLFLAVAFLVSSLLIKRHMDLFKMIIDSSRNKVVLRIKSSERRFLTRRVSAVYLYSKFKGEYTSADKRTNQEFRIIIGLELARGERYELFRFRSDTKNPSKEINEIHDYLKEQFRDK